MAVSPGRHGESVGDGDALGGQVAEHFPQAGVLAAHKGHVLDADLVKPQDIGVVLFHVGPP